MTWLTVGGKRGILGVMNSEPEASVELTNRRVVAVDGGTATGKGRLIEELSQLMRLKGVPVLHISTGNLYRAITVCSQDKMGRGEKSLEKIRAMKPEQMLQLARERHVEMHGGMVWVDGVPASIDDQLKASGVGVAIPLVARHLLVRDFVTEIVRRQVNEFDGYLLIDGRDIGGHVVPDAKLKLLLTVSPDIAAQRSREHTKDQIIARDKADQNREYGSLPHPGNVGTDVIVLPTDEHTPESVRDHVYQLMRKVWPELPPF